MSFQVCLCLSREEVIFGASENYTVCSKIMGGGGEENKMLGSASFSQHNLEVSNSNLSELAAS